MKVSILTLRPKPSSHANFPEPHCQRQKIAADCLFARETIVGLFSRQSSPRHFATTPGPQEAGVLFWDSCRWGSTCFESLQLDHCFPGARTWTHYKNKITYQASTIANDISTYLTSKHTIHSEIYSQPSTAPNAF